MMDLLPPRGERHKKNRKRNMAESQAQQERSGSKTRGSSGEQRPNTEGRTEKETGCRRVNQRMLRSSW
ncbi:hypothetical protein ILYODFUR_012791 [Ilyodon furcidens]|uniref:Uncharacterized protein n=1 Tax=Ilyodon furcidens TaxID=33524 RepID=A0ABV0TY90_9TELE